MYRSRNCFESSVPSVNRSPIRYTFCDAPFHYLVQCEHSLERSVSDRFLKRSESSLNTIIGAEIATEPRFGK